MTSTVTRRYSSTVRNTTTPPPSRVTGAHVRAALLGMPSPLGPEGSPPWVQKDEELESLGTYHLYQYPRPRHPGVQR